MHSPGDAAAPEPDLPIQPVPSHDIANADTLESALVSPPASPASEPLSTYHCESTSVPTPKAPTPIASTSTSPTDPLPTLSLPSAAFPEDLVPNAITPLTSASRSRSAPLALELPSASSSSPAVAAPSAQSSTSASSPLKKSESHPTLPVLSSPSPILSVPNPSASTGTSSGSSLPLPSTPTPSVPSPVVVTSASQSSLDAPSNSMPSNTSPALIVPKPSPLSSTSALCKAPTTVPVHPTSFPMARNPNAASTASTCASGALPALPVPVPPAFLPLAQQLLPLQQYYFKLMQQQAFKAQQSGKRQSNPQMLPLEALFGDQSLQAAWPIAGTTVQRAPVPSMPLWQVPFAYRYLNAMGGVPFPLPPNTTQAGKAKGSESKTSKAKGAAKAKRGHVEIEHATPEKELQKVASSSREEQDDSLMSESGRIHRKGAHYERGRWGPMKSKKQRLEDKPKEAENAALKLHQAS
eukprot:g7314.t1